MEDIKKTEAARVAARAKAEADFKSYGDIIWNQFQKYPLSYYSMYGVLWLFIIAVLAPVLALNVPFYASIPEGVGAANLAGVHFPWFTALFDRNFFESGLDIFFNMLIFTMPLNFVIWLVLKKSKGAIKRREFVTMRTRFISWSALAQVIVFTAIYFGGFREPYVDWISLSGDSSVSTLFPLLKYSYRDVDLTSVILDPDFTHFLGTDREGRDVFTRILYGTRISLTIGVVAVAIYTTIGVILGGLAGYFGKWVDMIVLRLVEVMICFPTFFLILTLRGFIDDPSIFHIMLIIGLTGWTGIARLVRAEFLRLKRQDFVQAAIALGLTERRIIFRHVMPNALGPVFVSATFGVAGAILIEASLSFLGLGPATAPSWGQILTAGRETGKDVLILAPGLAIFVTVILLNLVGEGARDALDPKLRK